MTAAMIRLPPHLPVLTVSPTPAAPEQVLIDSLLAALEAEGVRTLMLAGGQPPSAAQLVELLAGADLLIGSGSVIDASGHLSFCDNRAVGQQPEAGSFTCIDPAAIPVCAAQIVSWLTWCAGATPVAGAILIGGRSSRMGRPKHLIEDETGKAWVEIAAKALSPFVTDLVISGQGRLPKSLNSLARVDDLPEVQGPLAGFGALFRDRPFTSWLVAACDMPHMSESAIEWLLAQRRQGCLGVTPKNPRTGRNEPLLSWYDYRCGPLIEEMIASGELKISAVCGHERILQPPIPEHLLDCWRNINVPGDI